ncbi:MAG: ribonuclease D [Slackia sp.]|nr:ribonuclease D [Slackia sp.]
MYIVEQKQLKEFVSHAKTSSILAVDTEFLREKTYWPKLCLIQLATDEMSVAIDPFRVGDLSALADLFVDERITKLFHAAHQDIELIFHELGVIPKPVFDTQVAASLLGDALQIGYGTLIMNECGVKLKKADSFTDWSRRPLTDSQIAYALDDVVYLPRAYRSMRAKLERLGRLSWLDPDFEELCDPRRYKVEPFERYKRLRRVNQLSHQQLSAAREIAAWREETAMKRNIPRKWVLTDEQIVEICKREPASIDELFMVRGVSNALRTDDARKVLAACKKGLAAPEDQWPELNRGGKNEPNVDPQVDLLYSVVRLRAKEAGVAFGVLASHDDLAKIVRGHLDEADVLKGWRRRLVGEELLSIVRGELVVGIEDGVLRVMKAGR